MEKCIKLQEDDSILKLPIYTSDGKNTGNYLEFNLEDIELPIKYQELMDRDKKNRNNLQDKLHSIDKKEDVDEGKTLTRNEREKIIAIQDFLKEEVKIYNIFLGENGVEKLLNGKSLQWNTLQKIDKLIEEQILPHLNIKMESINEKIKKKYATNEEEEIEVL
jgi:hypothetical protein